MRSRFEAPLTRPGFSVVLGLIVILAASACAGGPASPAAAGDQSRAPQPSPTAMVPAPDADVDARVGVSFSLQDGQSAFLVSEHLHVLLTEIDVEARGATVQVVRYGQDLGTFRLGAADIGPSIADLGGHSLQLMAVSPTRSGPDAPYGARLLVTAGERVVDANNRFAFDLLAELRRQDGDENLFLSPLSIAMALAMTYNGAAGETEEAMANVLHLSEMERSMVNTGNAAVLHAMDGRKPDLELSVANSLWAREGVPFREEFFERVRRHYEAEVASLVFDDAAKERINGWVEERTSGKIDSILEEIRPGDVMYLINAVYFNGTWLYQFSEENTEEALFHNADGSRVQVPTMRQSGKFDYLDGDGFAALRLPYHGNASMYIFLPDRDSSLPEFLDRLDANAWAEWTAGFREGGGDIAMPRFELEYDIMLNGVLKAMGMEIAFGGGADFSDMGPGSLYVDRVVHKTVVEVHEKGTEAAAATLVVIAESAPAFNFEFTVDRPFFFAITDDQTGSVLFAGAVHELGE